MFFHTLHPQAPFSLLILIQSLGLCLNLTSSENPSHTPSDEVMCPTILPELLLPSYDAHRNYNYTLNCITGRAVCFFFNTNLSSMQKDCFSPLTIVSLHIIAT